MSDSTNPTHPTHSSYFPAPAACAGPTALSGPITLLLPPRSLSSSPVVNKGPASGTFHWLAPSCHLGLRSHVTSSETPSLSSMPPASHVGSPSLRSLSNLIAAPRMWSLQSFRQSAPWGRTSLSAFCPIAGTSNKAWHIVGPQQHIG